MVDAVSSEQVARAWPNFISSVIPRFLISWLEFRILHLRVKLEALESTDEIRRAQGEISAFRAVVNLLRGESSHVASAAREVLK